MIESAAELRGLPVITREDGVLLGSVSGITVDPVRRAIATLTLRTRAPKKELFVPMEEVELIGRDAILIKAQASARPIEKPTDLPGKSLRALQGAWVTTLEGKHLGTLVDIDFSGRDGQISEIELAEGKRVSVEAAEITIGDEILVPASCVERMADIPRGKYGLLGRLLGTDRIDDLRHTLQRVLGRKPKSEKPEKPEGRP
jgi:sporulation protein YlmC with PRC-barrel domain